MINTLDPNQSRDIKPAFFIFPNEPAVARLIIEQRKGYISRMTNNSVLQKIQFALNLSTADIVGIYKLVNYSVADEKTLAGYFIDNKSEAFVLCPNQAVAAFLDGLIISRRGVNEKNPAPAGYSNIALDNNDVFKKLRIAFDFHTEDLEVIFEKAMSEVSKNDLSAFFRKKGHKHYKVCSDPILESFLIMIRSKKVLAK